MGLELYYPGLNGIIAGETAIYDSADEGIYRGYSIVELAQRSSFKEVVWLLLKAELPCVEHLADFSAILADEACLPLNVESLHHELPLHLSNEQFLSTMISLLANLDAQCHDHDIHSYFTKTIRLLARLPLIISTRYRFLEQEDLIGVDHELSYSANLFHLLTGHSPSSLQEEALETALIFLCTGPFDTATFAVRVLASTGSDYYSLIHASISAMSQSTARDELTAFQSVLQNVSNPDQAEEYVEAELQNQKIDGFVKSSEPIQREMDQVLREYCWKLSQTNGCSEYETTALRMEQAALEQGYHPSLYWTMGRLFIHLQIPDELHYSLLLLAKIVGWSAHAMEQLEEEAQFSPRARYRGALDLDYEPLSQRG